MAAVAGVIASAHAGTEREQPGEQQPVGAVGVDLGQHEQADRDQHQPEQAHPPWLRHGATSLGESRADGITRAAIGHDADSAETRAESRGPAAGTAGSRR